MTDQTAISLVKPTTAYRFHLKASRSIEGQGLNPGDALLWTGYLPKEVAWFEVLGPGIHPADYASRA